MTRLRRYATIAALGFALFVVDATFAVSAWVLWRWRRRL